MGKYEIFVDEDKCSLCRRCQLGCSNAYLREFNQNLANIIIQVQGSDVSISFTEQCRRCGICVDCCFYGALIKMAQEAA